MVLGDDVPSCGTPSITKKSSGAMYGAVPTLAVVNPKRFNILEMPKSHMQGAPRLSTNTLCFSRVFNVGTKYVVVTHYFQVSVNDIMRMEILQPSRYSTSLEE